MRGGRRSDEGTAADGGGSPNRRTTWLHAFSPQPSLGQGASHEPRYQSSSRPPPGWRHRVGLRPQRQAPNLLRPRRLRSLGRRPTASLPPAAPSSATAERSPPPSRPPPRSSSVSRPPPTVTAPMQPKWTVP